MESSGATSRSEWSAEDVEVGADAVSSASSTDGYSSHQVVMEAYSNSLRLRPLEPRPFFKFPTAVAYLVVLMAIAYLAIRCGRQFAQKHQGSRHLAEAPDPASCSGGGEEGGDEKHVEEEETLDDAELGARVEATLKSLEALAGTAEEALTGLPSETRIPAATLLLGTAVVELTAYAGFMDGKLEAARKMALNRFRAFQGRLWQQMEEGDKGASSGRRFLKFHGTLADAFLAPSWANFPSAGPRRKLLQDLLVMTKVSVEACNLALSVLAPSSGLYDEESRGEAAELLRRVRGARMGHVVSHPELARLLDEMRKQKPARSLYSEKYCNRARAGGPIPLQGALEDFHLHAGGLVESLKRRMQRATGGQPLAAPPAHSPPPHGPRLPHQTTQQQAGAAALQGPFGPLPSTPFPRLPRQMHPPHTTFLAPLPPSPLLQGHPPPAVPPSVLFPPGFPPQTGAGFHPGHLATGPMALRAPPLPPPFQAALPPPLPPAPLPFIRPRHGAPRQTPPAGAGGLWPPFAPRYPTQQTRAARFPPSTQPGAQPVPGTQPPYGGQAARVSLAPGAHRASAAFHGHPLGTPADSGASGTHSQAPYGQAPPPGDAHDEQGGKSR